MAAAAIGLCISRDGGVTWDVEQEGLHASYCSAVAFAGDDVFVSASVDHFAAKGAIYRRRVDGQDSLVAVGGGLPAWTDGIVDTGCIATRGSAVALADWEGNLYVSADTGRSWSRRASGLPPRAASSSSERDTRTAKRRAGRVMCHLAFSTFRESTLQRRRTLSQPAVPLASLPVSTEPCPTVWSALSDWSR